eukprot:478357-Pyramimonas_sp.AAC.3
MALRAAYSLLSLALPHMYYLQKATGAVLVFVGVRALADYFGVQLPTGISLIAIIVTLAGSAAASIWSADWVVDVSEGGDVEMHHASEVPVQTSSRPTEQVPTERPAPTYPAYSGAPVQQTYSAPAPKPAVPRVSQGASGPGKGRSIAADLIGSALGDTEGSASASSLAFKLTAQD